MTVIMINTFSIHISQRLEKKFHWSFSTIYRYSPTGGTDDMETKENSEE